MVAEDDISEDDCVSDYSRYKCPDINEFGCVLEKYCNKAQNYSWLSPPDKCMYVYG